MTARVLCILDGMGPEATIFLQQKVLAAVQARDDIDHLPLLTDMNPKLPSHIAHLTARTGEGSGPVLANMAKRLEAVGATAVGMPCNTAHHYTGAVASAVSIPFLSMAVLSVMHAAARLKLDDRIGFLASPAMQSAGVFENALTNASLKALWPEGSDRRVVAIREFKALGPTPRARQVLLKAAHDLFEKAATVLFVAYSEFSLIARDLPEDLPFIDTIDVPADAIHNHSLANEVIN